MTEDNKPDVGRNPVTVLRILLIASLMLNLLFVGLAAGRIIALRGPGHMPRAMQVEMPDFGGALDRADREALGQRLRTRAGEIYRNAPNRAAAMMAFEDALRAEPFDRAALERLFAAQRATNDQMMEAAHAALLDRLEAMAPEQRLRFANRFHDQFMGPRGGN